MKTYRIDMPIRVELFPKYCVRGWLKCTSVQDPGAREIEPVDCFEDIELRLYDFSGIPIAVDWDELRTTVQEKILRQVTAARECVGVED
jgi:hypothetical protein